MGHRPSLLERLTASSARLDNAELQADVEQQSCCPLQDIHLGQFTTAVGRLRAVVYTPDELVPTLEAELFDGSDSVGLVWLGRRRIAGIEPGRRIKVTGRVGEHHGRLAIYNPRYELQQAGV